MALAVGNTNSSTYVGATGGLSASVTTDPAPTTSKLPMASAGSLRGRLPAARAAQNREIKVDPALDTYRYRLQPRYNRAVSCLIIAVRALIVGLKA